MNQETTMKQLVDEEPQALVLGALVLPALILVAGEHIHYQELFGTAWVICSYLYQSQSARRQA